MVSPTQYDNVDCGCSSGRNCSMASSSLTSESATKDTSTTQVSDNEPTISEYNPHIIRFIPPGRYFSNRELQYCHLEGCVLYNVNVIQCTLLHCTIFNNFNGIIGGCSLVNSTIRSIGPDPVEYMHRNKNIMIGCGVFAQKDDITTQWRSQTHAHFNQLNLIITDRIRNYLRRWVSHFRFAKSKKHGSIAVNASFIWRPKSMGKKPFHFSEEYAEEQQVELTQNFLLPSTDEFHSLEITEAPVEIFHEGNTSPTNLNAMGKKPIHSSEEYPEVQQMELTQGFRLPPTDETYPRERTQVPVEDRQRTKAPVNILQEEESTSQTNRSKPQLPSIQQISMMLSMEAANTNTPPPKPATFTREMEMKSTRCTTTEKMLQHLTKENPITPETVNPPNLSGNLSRKRSRDHDTESASDGGIKLPRR
ncbi:hypothetical protein EJ08DRAFT_385788 [Tothia fuscella]|uniref:Uncharacterized protein n=1 Tax=Tothia fuscella TaxID=1048955 RepID=A0A9P4U2K8_9PEZI|nr:hypothetical protein EJ08DRAFT_385788 [Tothia fuscella]